jgi:hypothetical protein
MMHGQNPFLELVLKMGPEAHGGPHMDPREPGHHGPVEGKPPMDGPQSPCEPDWKQIALQLMESISLIDTATDGAESGSQTPDGALAAVDDMTSRLLWGKQEDDDPTSMYQNANYTEKTANGFMMDNPADLDGDDGMEEEDEKKKREQARKKGAWQQ